MRLSEKLMTVAACAALAFTVASCGTKKVVAEGNSFAASTVTGTGSTQKSAEAQTELSTMNCLRRVADNAVYSKNIVSKIKCTISTGSNNISVGGSLHMRRDEVIRIQLVPFGIMEVGRLEFTKDHVLLIDRINKEYVKASYSDVDFLKNNGLDFYALQALFWNQLYVPGMQKVTDSSLKSFAAEIKDGVDTKISTTYGKMTYVWTADKNSALIKSVTAKYASGKGDNASVNCQYSGFKSLGTKLFPTGIYLTMNTKMVKNASKMSLDLQLNTLTTDSDWDAETSVSSKYTQVGVEEILTKLGGM